MLKPTHELAAGDRFPSPRAEEGVVVAVCDYGRCHHNDDRPDSIHVRAADGAQFFIALPPDTAHVCETYPDRCPAEVTIPLPYDPGERTLPHLLANRHLG